MPRYYHNRLDNGQVEIGDDITKDRITFFASESESEHLYYVILLLDQRIHKLEQRVSNLSLKNGFE